MDKKLLRRYKDLVAAAAPKKNLIELIVKIVSRTEGYRFDPVKFGASYGRGDEGIYLITIENDLVIGITGFKYYRAAKQELRNLYEKFSNSGEITNRFVDGFVVKIYRNLAEEICRKSK